MRHTTIAPNLSYLAGLFDGEGWFLIRRVSGHFSRARRPFAFQCMAALTIREKEAARLFLRFGGKVTIQKGRRPNHRDCYKWQAVGMDARRFAREIAGRLVVKRERALVLIEFQGEKIKNGNRPLSDLRYSKYVALHRRMATLNKRGNP